MLSINEKKEDSVNIKETDLTSKTMSGIIWKLMERILAEVVALVVSIVLARILLPNDYSIVSLVTIFITFANVLITSGLNTALIQKKDADYLDYNTVLIVSTLISVVIYVALFFTAPYIAEAYGIELLVPVFRVMGLVLIVNAVKSILCAYVSNRMEFKKFFWSTFVGTALSGVIGIVMAYTGFGVWALVAQYVLNALIDTTVLFFTTRFKVNLVFSVIRFRSLWSYGWKVFATEIISMIYENTSPMVIGIRFSTENLAFFTKGRLFPNVANSTITSTLSAVLFPAMSKIQDDKEKLLDYTRKFVKVASYCIAPMLMGFFAVSDNFVLIILTEKWLPASAYIKIFCISYMINILTTANLQVIRASGRSDVLLKLEIIKKISYLFVLVTFVLFSNTPEIMALSSIVINIMAMLINGYPNRKLIGYKYKDQFFDVFPNMMIAMIMAVVVYSLNYIRMNIYILFALQIFTGVVVYILLSILFKPTGYLFLIKTIKEFKTGRKNREK